MTDEISSKNTKNEILDAYNEVLKKLKDTKKTNNQEQKISAEKKEIVTTASQHTANDIVKNLAELKLSLVKSLEEIEEKLLSSHKKLATLQQAIDIQSKDLNDIHEIKINADTLSALLLAQSEKSAYFDQEMKSKRESFEQEIGEKRLLWKKEQDEFEATRKEQETQIKKMRQREEEEYIYQRDLLRQKEHDQYMAEKKSLEQALTHQRTTLEKEFSTREEQIATQEQTLQMLKEKTENFPVELKNAVEETEKLVTERLTFKHDYEVKLAQKEVEGEQKLYQQMISALEAKVAHLETQAKHLTDKTNQANLQVQDIAVKAIEGASRQRYNNPYPEKILETAKSQ